MLTRVAIALLLMLVAAQTVAGRQDDRSVKIGFLVDMAGPTSSTDGPATIEAARMAIDDFGGKALGRPIALLVADHQNKPDIGATLARRWYDAEDVDAIFDVNNSAVAFAVQDLARQAGRIVVFTAAASADLTGRHCSPNGFHWLFDTYSQAAATSASVVKEGGDTWFYVTVDYTFGRDLEAQSRRIVEASGGTVLGSVRHPLGTADFSSYLLQVLTAKPKVLAFANSVQDLMTATKQAAEFRLPARRVTFFFSLQDARALGLDAVAGLQFLDAFYWDADEPTRQWSARFRQRTGKMPTSQNAGAYSAVMHYLKAVERAGTDETEAVLKVFRSMPVDDFMTAGAPIREDGRLLRDMYLLEVKSPAESRSDWDYFKVVRRIPGREAFRPLSEGGCPLVKP
jgi:branched-chain amino acid transport system substrate-binding protein